MPTKLATGLCIGTGGAAVVAREAAMQAKEELKDRRIDLSIIYSSSEYDPREVVSAVRKVTGDALLIGASSAGEFTERKIESGSVAVGLLSSDEIKIFTAIAEGVTRDPESAVKEIAAKLPDEVVDYPYMTAIVMIDGLSGVGEEVALLASYILDRKMRIVGGMAGDDFKMKETFVFCNDRVATDALSVCLFASKMPLFTGVKHGHTPISRAHKVTRAQTNVLHEINDAPAWDVWKEETAEISRNRGVDVEKLVDPVEIAQFFTNYSLGLATEKEGQYKIRWPVSINDDGALNFTCGITEGSIFRIMDGSDHENQINAAEGAAVLAKESAENAGYFEFAGMLVFDCAVRQLMLGDRFHEAVDRFKKVLPGVPILGWETYGELRLEPGQFSGFHNTTSVVLLLPDGSRTA
ncbi:MAG: FIST N-terminal domain-containing protein [Euryarchaeota archaeon]|nr:FIST N-terminal domain-containing protein [Euryarchaeota archaeon]